MTTREHHLAQAKEELYTAIQAIEDGDLPFARSSAARGVSYVTEAWQADRPLISKREINLKSSVTNVGRSTFSPPRSLLSALTSPTDD